MPESARESGYRRLLRHIVPEEVPSETEVFGRCQRVVFRGMPLRLSVLPIRPVTDASANVDLRPTAHYRG